MSPGEIIVDIVISRIIDVSALRVATARVIAAMAENIHQHRSPTSRCHGNGSKETHDPSRCLHSDRGLFIGVFGVFCR